MLSPVLILVYGLNGVYLAKTKERRDREIFLRGKDQYT